LLIYPAALVNSAGLGRQVSRAALVQSTGLCWISDWAGIGLVGPAGMQFIHQESKER